jgi:hypothetical protein
VLTRDTTEADIKQRREIRAGSARYVDLVGKKMIKMMKNVKF